jgi:hypothetical protein
VAAPPRGVEPRTFFLNEQHELARGEKPRGGSQLKLASIDWGSKGKHLHDTLSSARDSIRGSNDPLRDRRYFLATIPSPHIKKRTDNVRLAPSGIVEERTDYAGEHSLVFKRLGLDLLAVDEKGSALVHMPASRVEQLLATAQVLETEGPREKARWVSIDSFQAAPASFRVDKQWVDQMPSRGPVDAVVELQPLLTRVEVEEVIRAIVERIAARATTDRFTRAGTDFSGRHWYRGRLSRASLELIAQDFFSVQSLHSPLRTEAAASQIRGPGRASAAVPAPPQLDIALLPAVAVVDVGIPDGHLQLAPFRRGSYTAPDVPSGLVTDHGSRVASRVVFGDPQFYGGVVPVNGSCRFVDVNVAMDAVTVDDKAVIPAIQAVIGTYPDVRVFNLSFGEYPPLWNHPAVERREKLLVLQDLDNFIFRSDLIVIVAAGNSPPGLRPAHSYPDHVEDRNWDLGSWPCGFNTLKCGSYVGHLGAAGLVKNLGWPSPFTRVGPGLCGAPVPEFSANGGNCTDTYQYAPGLGVWSLNSAGQWEDAPGTSYAAPLLAREAAFAAAELQRRCEQGARPFAATVKAIFALTCDPAPQPVPKNVNELMSRTLGRGTASSGRIRQPRAASAVMVWQGILNSTDEKIRIQVPIPAAWLKDAESPTLRVIAAWETPVNAAVEHIWASRRVAFQLRPDASGKAVIPQGRSHDSYPLVDRIYPLDPESLARKEILAPKSDSWVLEVSYSDISEYVPTVEFSGHQRVGIAMELMDRSDKAVSPQAALQALPQAVSMARLTIPENRVANPIIVRPRI